MLAGARNIQRRGRAEYVDGWRPPQQLEGHVGSFEIMRIGIVGE